MSEWLSGAAKALQSLTLRNVAILALILALALPVWIIWKLMSDPVLLDRFLSSYREIPSDTGCTIRVVAERGAAERWAISTGFAFAGADSWQVSVVLDHEPDEKEVASHCATLLLITEKMHEP